MDGRSQKHIMKLKLDLIEKFGKNISKNINLSNYSWFNLGGPAEYLFKPENTSQLLEFLKYNKKTNFNLTVIGAGSNTLIRDKGIKGVVIKLGSNFSKIELLKNDLIEVGAGALDRKIADFAKINGIGGLEFLSCIPGSIGGSVKMNSGCYERDISKIIVSIKAIDPKECKEKEIDKKNIKFFYRGTNLPNELIITSIKLNGKKMPREAIEKHQTELIQKKKMTQPSQIKTCGSTFKNLDDNKKAWQIIKETGCDKLKEGGASISEKHCNFFVNNGSAKSADIEKLINKVKQKVNEKTGIDLELEIKIIGD